MTANRPWSSYPDTYRAREMKILAGWISAGESGSVVGLPGCGRSNLLGFLCYRPDVLQSYLLPQIKSVVLIPVDLNNLPANNLSTLYRAILRSFYRVRDQLDPTIQQTVAELYEENRRERDSFLTQSALQELLLLFQDQQVQVVLVLNRFDHFFQTATPQMVNTLRGLRDDFKNTLCYIAGMTQEVAYLPDPTALGEMYELLDSFVCWVGSMGDEDARNLICRATRTAPEPPTETDVAMMLSLTGRFPVLLRATCQWWLTTEPKPTRSNWLNELLVERSIQHRLAKIWLGLTQEEQFILSELQRLQVMATGAQSPKEKTGQIEGRSIDQIFQGFVKQHWDILAGLAAKGICHQAGTQWYIGADLLAAFIATAKGRGRGRIWLEEGTGEIYQGQILLANLTSLERSVLTFLVKYPRMRHTKTDLIISTWPEEIRRQGVTDNSLYQVILTLRRAIEPNPNQPSYLVTWRGKPEGGYQFFPEGRPGG